MGEPRKRKAGAVAEKPDYERRVRPQLGAQGAGGSVGGGGGTASGASSGQSAAVVTASAAVAAGAGAGAGAGFGGDPAGNDCGVGSGAGAGRGGGRKAVAERGEWAWDVLGPDVWPRLIDMCGLRTKAALMATCRALRRTVGVTRHWTKLDLRGMRLSDEMVAALAARAGGQCTELRVSRSSRLTGQGIRALAATGVRNLRVLHIHRCEGVDQESLTALLKAVPDGALREVQLGWVYWMKERQAKEIARLNKFRNVTRLCLRGCPFNDAGVHEFFLHAPNVEDLDLSMFPYSLMRGVARVSTLTLIRAAEMLPKLTRINMSGRRSIGLRDVVELVRDVPSLQMATLLNCPNAPASTLRATLAREGYLRDDFVLEGSVESVRAGGDVDFLYPDDENEEDEDEEAELLAMITAGMQ